MSDREKVLIITQYSLPAHKKNMNAYQRNFYGSEYVDITLLVRRHQEMSDELQKRVTIHRTPFSNRWLFLCYAILFSGYMRLRGMKIFITEPTGMAAAGYVSKLLFRTFWVLDLWDRPQWRPGQHEESAKRSLYDRLVFWIMHRASFYMLSCMRECVKDVDPPEERCAYFHNALDPDLFASDIPERSRDDTTLHLAFGKSIFDDTVGLGIVLDAAEQLVEEGCDFHFHIIGKTGPGAEEAVSRSQAADYVTLHGVTVETRVEFFHRMHAGIVPYMNYEDLKYIYPIKVLEHLSQGNPVIASDLPGLKVMVEDDRNGIIVPPDDAGALAAAVRRLQGDYDLWEKMARNALDSIRRFDAREKNKGMFTTLLKQIGKTL